MKDWAVHNKEHKKASSLRTRLSLLFFVIFFLPHGEVTGSRESGLDPKARQNPTIENIPGGNDAG
jgi:hypothetical protein